jgi:hypothetical protein
MITRLKRGGRLRIRLHDPDDWTPAFVEMASDTEPASLLLRLDGPVRTSDGGLIANLLPIYIDYGQEKVTSVFGDTYEIEVPAA